MNRTRSIAGLAAALGASDAWRILPYESTPTSQEGARAYRQAKAEREAREASEAKASENAKAAAEAKRAKRRDRNRRAAGLPEPTPYQCESCDKWPECREGGCLRVCRA